MFCPGGESLGFIFLSSPGFLYLHHQPKPTNMYSLNCTYYTKEFRTIDALINDIMESGMDPNYEITFNGKPTGEIVFDLIQM